jgi:hypothetical protein
VSHQPERTEKNCLNCGTMVAGRYCQTCGQENIEPKQSFGSLIKHFIYDVFHFDGKFFDTLKLLLFRPGRVPLEYIAGKRVHFLDPIRMYLFTSAVFFIVFFALNAAVFKITDSSTPQMNRNERIMEATEVMKELKANRSDSARFYKISILLDTTLNIGLKKPERGELLNDSFLVTVRNDTFIMEPDIDSTDFFAITKKEVWFERIMRERFKQKKALYGDNRMVVEDIANEFTHKMPYLLFVSLPIFALLLKLLYIRRKNFYYSDHAIFTLYHYIFSFILLLFYFGFDVLRDWLGWKIFTFIIVALMLYWGLYLLIGMKSFYKQSWGKTIAKFFLLDLLGFFTLLLLFTIFIFLTFIF